VGSGGGPVGVVAAAELDGAEAFPVGGIDRLLGHAAEGLVGGRPELVRPGADARFTAFRGR
jgi:hypothetical protein